MTPVCVLYGIKDGAPFLALQSLLTTLQLISNGQIVDLQTVINIPSTGLEENRYCIYLQFEKVATYEIIATLQCSNHNVSFPLIFDSISAFNNDSLHMHDGSRSKITHDVSEAIFLSSKIHEFKESVLFEFDFGDGTVAINESQSGMIEARHIYHHPGIFNITSTLIFEDNTLCVVGYIHRIEVNITSINDDRNYFERNMKVQEIDSNSRHDVRDNGDITYKPVYDKVSSDNESNRQLLVSCKLFKNDSNRSAGVISVKRRSTRPEDLQLDTTAIELDNDSSPTVEKSCLFHVRLNVIPVPLPELKNSNFSVIARPSPLIATYTYAWKSMNDSVVYLDEVSRAFGSTAIFGIVSPGSAYITLNISNLGCSIVKGIWVDILTKFDNYAITLTSKEYLIVNRSIDILITATGMEKSKIFFDISCDGKKLADIERQRPPSASKFSTSFVAVGNHYCEARAYIKGKPGTLENNTALGVKTTIRKDFDIRNVITMFRYGVLVSGATVESSTRPCNCLKTFDAAKQIIVYFISDGFNTTFSFMIYPYKDADARSSAKKHDIVGKWDAIRQQSSAIFVYSSNSTNVSTIELQADNVVSKKAGMFKAQFLERITPFQVQAAFYQKIRTPVKLSLTAHKGTYVTYYWQVPGEPAKESQTPTLWYTFKKAIGNTIISVFASNKISVYTISKPIYVYHEITGLKAQLTSNSSVFCVPTAIQIEVIAKGGSNVFCNISSGSRTWYRDTARPRAAGGEVISCSTTLNFASIGFYNFTVAMYNSVHMLQVQLPSIKGIVPDPNPFEVKVTSSTSTFETDAIFITKGNFSCPLLRCNFDFGDGANATFQHVVDGYTVRHRYSKMGHYKVSGKLKIYLLRCWK